MNNAVSNTSDTTATLTYLEGNFIKITHGTTTWTGESGEVYNTPKTIARAHKLVGGTWEGWDLRPGAEVERPVFADEQAAKDWVSGVFLRYCLAQILSAA